ncbi:unnamed protein product [Cercospora beticola]|nr:unnamed protein product [Cercospora beticola]
MKLIAILLAAATLAFAFPALEERQIFCETDVSKNNRIFAQPTVLKQSALPQDGICGTSTCPRCSNIAGCLVCDVCIDLSICGTSSCPSCTKFPGCVVCNDE